MKVDASRLLLRLSGRFSAAEASAGDGIKLTVALASLLPLETRLESLEVYFVECYARLDWTSFCHGGVTGLLLRCLWNKLSLEESHLR